MALSRRLHRAGVAVGVGGTELAATLGGTPTQVVAYAAAAVLGGVLYLQGDRRVVGGRVFPTLIVGFAAGTALSLLVAAGLLTWLLGAPWDFALWRMGVLMWGSWAGVAFAVVSSYFAVGVAVAST